MRCILGDSEGRALLPAARGTWSRNWEKDIVSLRWAVYWEGLWASWGPSEIRSWRVSLGD